MATSERAGEVACGTFDAAEEMPSFCRHCGWAKSDHPRAGEVGVECVGSIFGWFFGHLFQRFSILDDHSAVYCTRCGIVREAPHVD